MKNREEILEQQVEALEKLLQIKDAIVEELEKKIAKLEHEAIMKGFQPLHVPSVWHTDPCPLGGAHNYPLLWNGTTPPPCSKCGQPQNQSVPSYSPTSTVSVDVKNK